MLYLQPPARQKIIDDAIQKFPDECCGFLLGTEENDDRTVTEIIVVKNSKKGDKRRRFEITPRDYLRAEQRSAQKGLTLLGIYHSHPNHPSIPSEHDRKVAQPFFSYLIVSIQDGRFATLQSWRLNDDFRFDEEEVNGLKIAEDPSATPFKEIADSDSSIQNKINF